MGAPLPPHIPAFPCIGAGSPDPRQQLAGVIVTGYVCCLLWVCLLLWWLFSGDYRVTEVTVLVLDKC